MGRSRFPTIAASCVLALTACGQLGPQPLPTWEWQMGGGDEVSIGTVDFDGRCIVISGGDWGSGGVMLLWPKGYTLQGSGKDSSIVDDHGKTRAKIGDKVRVQGDLIVVSTIYPELLAEPCTSEHMLEVSSISLEP